MPSTIIRPLNSVPTGWPKGWNFPMPWPPGWPISLPKWPDDQNWLVKVQEEVRLDAPFPILILMRNFDGTSSSRWDGHFIRISGFCKGERIRLKLDKGSLWCHEAYVQIGLFDVLKHGIHEQLWINWEDLAVKEALLEFTIYGFVKEDDGTMPSLMAIVKGVAK